MGENISKKNNKSESIMYVRHYLLVLEKGMSKEALDKN